ncbi:MAG: hypothetical protein HY062_11880 [Bacteroidetes bacterium]|nr:hypothetical protein [Bacteroidota bacterium]
MNIITYVFIGLLILLLNEYRLIKKYINAIENKSGPFQAVRKPIAKASDSFKNWINHKVLNNELNY